jgi:tripartite-type tricarboxylate transporter receptor subunit TctC
MCGCKVNLLGPRVRNAGPDWSRLTCALVSIALAITIASSVHAQDALKGPVKLLVPLGSGSVTDIVARLIADSISQSVGQPVIVENRPGATGRIAAEALKNAPPDGTALMLAPIAVTVLNPLVYRHLSYDPVTDFAPVAQVAHYSIAFAVGSNNPAKTIPEFIAWAKAHPAQANFGTTAAGGLPHLFGVAVAEAGRVEMVHVTYNGAARLTADLMGGQVSAGIDTLPALIELHRAGKIRILAVSGTSRSSQLPEVPTFVEQHLTALDGDGWLGLYVPGKTPKPLIDRLSLTIVRAVHTPEIREKLLALGLEPTGTTPDALATIMAVDTARWAPVIKASGFSGE